MDSKELTIQKSEYDIEKNPARKAELIRGLVEL
jgi:hypothetical protein